MSKQRTHGEIAWDNLTPAQRKVNIAKDVIEQIQLSKLNMKGGVYICRPLSVPLSMRIPVRKRMTEECVEFVQRQCDVCARGALLLRRVALFDKLRWGQLGIHADGSMAVARAHTTRGLKDAFTARELALIEAAFEVDYVFAPSHPMARYAAKFGEDFPFDPADRMIAICQNIIDHKGEFRPEVRYIMYWK